ncbi:MAG TPA: efflux RND transporter periplasmic adaptor subunit [Thermoanaerobaculia bacterium]|jgi:multidrug efflux pump subunit AcrA (membrane-fusion protein)|nr:efflux RND transporter periplasmic adaptor subunit [Thermoanaerobaculia bacterium]
MSPRQRRFARFAAGGAVLAAAALGFWLVSARASASAGGGWMEVRREDLVIGVPVSGTLSSTQAVSIGPPQIEEIWDYKISFMAPEGAPVKAGQPVLGFDSSELQQKLQEKMAQRDSAQKELEKRQTSAELSHRDATLELAEAAARQRRAALKVEVPPALVAAKELAKSREDLALANREIAYLKEKMRLEASQAGTDVDALVKRRDRAAGRVQEMQDAIRRMMVPASRDGTVVYVATDNGGKKKIGDSCWRGQSVVEIPDLRQMQADGEVDEADAGRVAAGQRVTFRLDSHPDDVFTGRVRVIGGAVSSRSDVNPLKVVKLTIDLDRTDPQRMSPGMRFLGTVEIERAPHALVAPAEAVFTRPEGPVVYRRSGWGSEPVHPVLGRRNDRLVEIKSGLRPGDMISRRDLTGNRGGGGAGG